MDFGAIASGEGKRKKKEKESAPPPAPRDLYSLEEARTRFLWVQEELDRRLTEAKLIRIESEDQLKAAIEFAANMKTLGKKVEEERKKYIQVPWSYCKTVNAFAKTMSDKIEAAFQTAKRHISDYQYHLEIARLERERIAQEAAKQLQLDLDKQSAEKGVARVEVPPPVLPKPDTVARAETGATSHVRREWKGEIIEADQVPREFCSPDSRKINEAVKAGIREIPGVRIFEDRQAVIRT